MKEGHIVCGWEECLAEGKPETIRKHRSRVMHQKPKQVGRPAKTLIERSAAKKKRNEAYYHKKKLARPRSMSTETAATTPKKTRKKAPRKVMASGAEPSGVIGYFNWLPVLSPDEALDKMHSHYFWLQCIEHHLDPLWAYRYLCWRLGRPCLKNWRLANSIPPPNLCIETVLVYMKNELKGCDEKMRRGDKEKFK